MATLFAIFSVIVSGLCAVGMARIYRARMQSRLVPVRIDKRRR
ncbi:MAG TPA: hypothetical protein VIJ06_00410 [Methylovirgula sp.]